MPVGVLCSGSTGTRGTHCTGFPGQRWHRPEPKWGAEAGTPRGPAAGGGSFQEDPALLGVGYKITSHLLGVKIASPLLTQPVAQQPGCPSFLFESPPANLSSALWVTRPHGLIGQGGLTRPW